MKLCGTETWYHRQSKRQDSFGLSMLKPMRGIDFVPIRSDPILIFVSGNRPLCGLMFSPKQNKYVIAMQIYKEQDACSGVHTGLRMRRYVLWCNIHGSGGQESS